MGCAVKRMRGSWFPGGRLGQRAWVLCLLTAHVALADEPVAIREGEYIGKVLIPSTAALGIGGTMTDEPCTVTITRQADGRAEAAVSFLAEEGPLPLQAEDDGTYWAALDERQAVVVRLSQRGEVMLATHTGRDADGRPHQAFLGFGEFVQECVIEHE